MRIPENDAELALLRARRDRLRKEQEKDFLRKEVDDLEKKYGGRKMRPAEARRQAQEDIVNAKFEKMGIRINRRGMA